MALAGARCKQAAVLFPRTDDGIEVIGNVRIGGELSGMLVSEGTCMVLPLDALPGLAWCETEGEQRCSDPINLAERRPASECERLRFAKRDENGAWSMTAAP
jgi:hypothetical protein